MGVIRIFSKGGRQGIFPKVFKRGPKVATFIFSPFETKKTIFFAKIFKIAPCPPSDARGHPAVGCGVVLSFIWPSCYCLLFRLMLDV